MSRSTEEELIHTYFEAFNRHDIEGVMACFHDEPHLVGMEGVHTEGRAAVRRFYEQEFATFPDGRCELQTAIRHADRGMAESCFVGTHAQSGESVKAVGADVIEFDGGKIKTIRNYHRLATSHDEP